jgi:hypothetical protein
MHRRNKPSSAGSSTSSVRTPSTTSLLNAFDSPISQSSLSKPSSKASGKKRIRSDIGEQVDIVNEEIESLSSERLSRAEMKNERTVIKLDIYRQERAHQIKREEHSNDCQEAAAAHDRSQQSTEKAIRLREAEAAAHALALKVHEAEVKALELRIRLHELTKGDGAAK